MGFARRLGDFLFKCLTFFLVLITVFILVITVLTVTTVDKNERNIMGMRFYIVQTDSMSKSDKNTNVKVHFSAGDIVIIKNVEDTRSLKAGDIIAFISTNGDSYGETVTHMIREVKTNSKGDVIGYVTYGTNTDTNDEALVQPSHVLGVYYRHIPELGNFFAFMKTPKGYLACILAPFMVVIFITIINVVRLAHRYTKEKTEIIDAESAVRAAERRLNEEMLYELRRLNNRPTTPTYEDDSYTSSYGSYNDDDYYY